MAGGPMSVDDRPGCMVLLLLGVIAVILIGAAGWEWYRAGVQQAVYARQGIIMSQWEVFIGMEPAERVIQVKPEVPK